MEVDIYARLSLDRTGSELGVDRQVQEIRTELVEPHGWTVRHVRVDNDLSATTGVRRPAFEALLATEPHVPIACWHTDRLVRKTADLERVIALGVDVYALRAGHLDLSTPAGRAVARTITAWAAYEGEAKADRQRAAHQQRVRSGKPWWGAQRPFGYQSDGTVVEAEAELLRGAYGDLLAGLSLGAIAREWNARGILTPRGNGWKSVTVGQVLEAPRNAGLQTHHGEIVGKGDWEPLVEREVYDSTARLLGSPSRRNSGGGTRRTLLGGLLWCSACGSHCRRNVKRDPRRPDAEPRKVYQCHARTCVTYPADWLEMLIGEHVVVRLSAPDAAGVWEKGEDDTSTLREEVAGLRTKLDELAEDYAEGLITREQLRSGSVRLRERLEQAESLLVRAHSSTALQGLPVAAEIRSWWEGLGMDRQRAVIDVLMEKAELKPRGRGSRKPDPELVVIDWRTQEAPSLDGWGLPSGCYRRTSKVLSACAFPGAPQDGRFVSGLLLQDLRLLLGFPGSSPGVLASASGVGRCPLLVRAPVDQANRADAESLPD